MSDGKLRALIEEMRAGLEGVTSGPYRYRPHKYDDWGWVRAPAESEGMAGPIVVSARLPYRTEEELRSHRAAGTDPWEKDARHFARCSPENIALLLTAAESHLSASSNEGWRVKPLEEWREDCGFCLWWTWTGSKWLGEPSYIGSPLCDDWPGYHTHWTPHPEFPPPPSPGEEQ